MFEDAFDVASDFLNHGAIQTTSSPRYSPNIDFFMFVCNLVNSFYVGSPAIGDIAVAGGSFSFCWGKKYNFDFVYM